MRIRGALTNYGKHAGGSVSGGMGYAQFHQCLTMLIEFKAKSEQERLRHPEDNSQGGARPAASLHPWIYSHRHFGAYTMSVLMLLVLI